MVATSTRLGPYQILGLIGAGGMGEVYRARDTRLNRDVALKVLPTDATSDPDRLRRFEQEARAAAALNHPNILVVYDIGADSGLDYVVSELLEGETLRERLHAGPLPARKAFELAGQIARGLAAAHAKGIVHRDLKPDNIFVTRDGRVKILDFGLATVIPPAYGTDQTVASSHERLTTTGAVLGTVGYMSPEQVRGAAADQRSDIFSFGALLYEMLSGKRAFAGSSAADAMSAILSTDPPQLSGPGSTLSPMVDHLVRHCLEKNPDERFQSALDLAFNLDALANSSHRSSEMLAGVDAPSTRTRRPRRWATIAFAAGLILGAVAAWVGTSQTATPAQPMFQQLTFRRGEISSARFSPDGETIVYSGAWEGRSKELYSTRVGSTGERALGVQGKLLAISAAGEVAVLLEVTHQGWVDRGTLARLPLGGGAPREVLREVGGADFSPNGQTLAITRWTSQRRWRLEYPIGTLLYETENWIECPRVSRDGSKVLFLEHPPLGGDNRGHVAIVTTTREKSTITPDFSSLTGAAWGPLGDEVWFTAAPVGMMAQLMAVQPGHNTRFVAPFPSHVLLEDVLPNGRVLLQTRSAKARILVRTPTDTSERDISWFDWPLLRDMSPDGRHILFDEQGAGGGAGYSVFVRATDGAPAVRIGDGYGGRFSPDMQFAVTYPLDQDGTFVIVPLGPGEPRRLKSPLKRVGNVRWFPDGKRLAVIGTEEGRPPRVYEYTISSGTTRQLTEEGVIGGIVSPDGRKMIVVAAGTSRIVSVEGEDLGELKGVLPGDAVLRWTPDARALYVSAPLSDRSRDVARLDLATGRRQVFVVIAPSDGAGIRSVAPPVVSADGRTYAYRYNQILSDLFVASGLE